MNNLFLDFEFNEVTESPVKLVSCATFDPTNNEVKKWWLYNDKSEQEKLKNYLQKFDLMIGYSCVAECRSFIALGIDPLKFKWIDEFFEYRMLTNHNDRLQWGKQLKDGKVVSVGKPRPKWMREEGEEEAGFKAKHSLAEATFKLTGEIRDTEHKTAMRDLIISAPKEFSEEEKNWILDYGVDDVVHLPKIWERIQEEIKNLLPEEYVEKYVEEAIRRGRYAAHTAKMEDFGYPINVKATRNFSNQVGNILFDTQREINELFPDIKPFTFDKKESKYKWNQKATKAWVAKYINLRKVYNPETKKTEDVVDKPWILTEGKDLSLSLEAFQRYFDFKHDYPKDNFGAQIVRFLKLKQSIYGFNPPKEGSDRKTFWDFVGKKDGMVRPYTNPFGAQSSRSQPGSSGFMFLKPAWMRALVQPPPGYFMAGIDYGSQEFFISALWSEDADMIRAYLSGDVYLAFAKQAGMAPEEATKESHKKERDICKATVLGISYLMTKFGLAIKLTQDSGMEWSEEDAQEMIDKFDEAYPDFKQFREDIINIYHEYNFLRIPDGWYMFGDNENFRSVANCFIQGTGAAIMREAVDQCDARTVQVMKTNHDALYMYGKVGRDEHKVKLMADGMREAFVKYSPEHLKQYAEQIRLDPFIWSSDYTEDNKNVIVEKKKNKKGEEETNLFIDCNGWKVPCLDLYIDDRAIDDYERFKKYFNSREEDLL